jgi:hypothetical protein
MFVRVFNRDAAPSAVQSTFTATLPVGGSGDSGIDTLEADRQYFIRTDGSDANDGLSNNAGGAWATPQKASDTVAGLFLNGFDVFIDVADGTYNLTQAVELKEPLGSGEVTMRGNATDDELVIFDCGGNDTGVFFFGSSTKWVLRDMRLEGGTQRAVTVGQNGYGVIRQMTIGDTGDRPIYLPTLGGQILIRETITFDYTTGTMDAFVRTLALDCTVDAQGCTVDVLGNPTFNGGFAVADRISRHTWNSSTVNGPFTGTGLAASRGSNIYQGSGVIPGGTSADATSQIFT